MDKLLPCPPRVTKSLPALTPIMTTARALNDRLWELLTRRGPLTPEEWAYVEDIERQEG